MITNFPDGYKCPQEYHDRWPELERTMLPLIKAKARRVRKFTGGLDMDDAIQEGRLALLAALSKYDADKGPLDRYVGVCLNNAYRGMVYEMLTKTRMPRAIVRGDGGEWEERPVPPLSLSGLMDPDEPGNYALTRAMIDHDMPTPEGFTQHEELEAQARIFKLKLLNSLKGRDKDVFECRTNPPVDFLKMVQNVGGDIHSPTIPHIAQYLDVSKNTVDWSLYKIKASFTRMARGEEFIDLFGDVVESREWPMIRLSKAAKHDTDFVAQVIQDRQLNPKPVEGYGSRSDFHQRAGMFSRMIERYPWGVVLVLQRKGVWRTLVIECSKFNANTGDVFGESGAHELVPVKWYPQMVKALNGKGKQS